MSADRIEALTESTGDGPTIHGKFLGVEPVNDCPNCHGRVCMDCVTRTIHDVCGDSPCPTCHGNGPTNSISP